MSEPLPAEKEKAALIVREAEYSDIKAVIALNIHVYGAEEAFRPEMIRSQIRRFPEGQFVAVYEGAIVGHCATFRINERAARASHSWEGITGGGFASRHEPDGDMLYGMEVCVNKELRGMRIGRRLYDARRNLCKRLNLKGIIFGGLMPGFVKRAGKTGTPEAYLEAVLARKYRDTVLSFQLKNGFEAHGVLRNYIKSETDPGHAALMIWRNPNYRDPEEMKSSVGYGGGRSVRLACVQLQARAVQSFDEFMGHIEYFIDVAADYTADFVVFPEMLTVPLLSAEKKRLSPGDGIKRITEYTEPFVEKMRQMAMSYNVNIIGGSHPVMQEDGSIENVCYVFLRDGSVHAQPKLHPTPSERMWWNIKGGDYLNVIDTDCGPVGVLICYDSEFPETARHLTDQGAQIIFVPYCTDERQGHNRVRYCCHARAVENQIYVATAGIVGNLPMVENMDIHYAESCILTPCDFPFARDGIAAEAPANTETIIFADVRTDTLHEARGAGTVRNLKDRRFDLYATRWYKGF